MRREGALLALAFVGIFVAAMNVPEGAEGAEPPRLTRFCLPGSAGGKCRLPRGVAVDPASGHAYVPDSGNQRLAEFDAWGEFVRAWGWDVAQSGPGNTGTGFEICVAANGDICQDGVSGDGSGQFGSGTVAPVGVALDAEGNVYVIDHGTSPGNRRVQKFDAAGDFLLMFGGEVNKSKVEEGAPEAEQNRCPIDPGDVCQAGTEGTGQGQFGAWPEGAELRPWGSIIDSSPDGETIYVGDQDRIQEFDTEGNYIGEIALAEAGVVGALAVDNDSNAPNPNFGDIYFSYSSFQPLFTPEAQQPNVHHIDPGTGNEVGTPLKVALPSTVATDGEGSIYVFDKMLLVASGDPRNRPARVLKFDSGGNLIDTILEGEFDESTGLAVSSACGLSPSSPDLFVANASFANSFVGIYGPPPDPEVCPPPERPPAIEDQYALGVGGDGATVRAEINPQFWPDTHYYVQYGTAACLEAEDWAASCVQTQPSPPGALLTEVVTNEALTTNSIFLGNLEPATTYLYRFASESTGGGPVFGAGATETEPEGEEGTFTTYPLPPTAKTDCPNQPFRNGASASLPDCRAYEMVSPVDKSNGDIVNDEAAPISPASNYEEVSPSGERATYSSIRSFGDPEGAPLISQYLSSRDPISGWSTHSIAPPRDSVPFYEPGAFPNTLQFKAFSEDLCRGWLIQDTDVALVPGAPSGVASIYRRDDGGCGDEAYELLTPVQPPGFGTSVEPVGSRYYLEVQGASANSDLTLLRIDAVLNKNACKTTPGTEGGKGIFQLYLHTIGEADFDLVSVLPSEAAACVHASAGTHQGVVGESLEDNVVNALSDDGSRVFWSASATSSKESPFSGGTGDQPGPLYLRLNPTESPSPTTLGGATGAGRVANGSTTVTLLETTSGAFAIGQNITGRGIPAGTTIASKPNATTLVLSAPATESSDISSTPAIEKFALEAWSPCTEPETKACTLPISSANNTRFWGADPQGTAAVYTANGGLHKYDVEEGASTTIAPSGVLGVMGMSTDLSRVYFISTADLTGGQENSEGDKAITGKPNLYLYEEGGGSVFVGTLAAVDTSNGAISLAPPSPIATLPVKRISRISADGQHAAFTSAAPLTGYDNVDTVSGEPVSEVFLYDAAPGGTGELTCVSCNPSGARPRGRNVHEDAPLAAATLPGWETQFRPTRALMNDGNRLFFESFEGLVLRDTNNRRDVYEWERAASEQECLKDKGAELYVEAAGGCISLISSGTSSLGSEFLDASADGRDAFFTTAASLLPQDPGLIDVYDAREGGGFPPPPAPKAPCEGEACQPAPAPPQAPSPASANFRGEGNVKEKPKRRRCAKGKRRVVKKGKARCVAKQKRKRSAQRKRRAPRRAAR